MKPFMFSRPGIMQASHSDAIVRITTNERLCSPAWVNGFAEARSMTHLAAAKIDVRHKLTPKPCELLATMSGTDFSNGA